MQKTAVALRMQQHHPNPGLEHQRFPLANKETSLATFQRHIQPQLFLYPLWYFSFDRVWDLAGEVEQERILTPISEKELKETIKLPPQK